MVTIYVDIDNFDYLAEFLGVLLFIKVDWRHLFSSRCEYEIALSVAAKDGMRLYIVCRLLIDRWVVTM